MEKRPKTKKEKKPIVEMIDCPPSYSSRRLYLFYIHLDFSCYFNKYLGHLGIKTIFRSKTTIFDKLNLATDIHPKENHNIDYIPNEPFDRNTSVAYFQTIEQEFKTNIQVCYN